MNVLFYTTTRSSFGSSPPPNHVTNTRALNSSRPAPSPHAATNSPRLYTMENNLQSFNSSDGDTPDTPFDPLKYPQRLLASQIAVAVALGVTATLAFCMLRRHYPQLYEARRSRRKDLPELSPTYFGWIRSLYLVTDEQVLEHAGLDAYVYLGFFKTSMQLLAILTLLAATVISPIRWHYTGRYDQSEDDYAMAILTGKKSKHPESYENYLWTYVVFTYIFTGLTAWFMVRQTVKVLQVRQRYLGQQNSVTDRTIKLSGIPPELRTETALKDYIEALGIGQVRRVELCLNLAKIDDLFVKRKQLMYTLEHAWSEYLGSASTREGAISLPAEDYNDVIAATASPPATMRKRPVRRLGLLGLTGPKVDVIDFYTTKLEQLDAEIDLARSGEYKPTDTAFVTMDSVASAQMAAQAVLDPRPQRLIASPAPAPHDIIWHNLYLSRVKRLIRSYSVTFVIAVLTIIFVLPVSYLASFLNPKTIEKLWPALYNVIDWDGWVGTFITGILPPLIFTLFNFMFPFLYWYLAGKQGFISNGEVELSVVSKNFFYVFFNMFLVFTVAGTASDVWALLKDTTKIAVMLAKSLGRLSLFYVDLIILQGVGMFPFRLLQVGSVVKLPMVWFQTQSARDLHNLSRPAIFNYGINLPQPILILIVVILYSVISSKILFFGALYFAIGYYVYKYQLMFSMVHPQHSTGRSWVTIMRRVIVGVILFHLTMTGILVLQGAFLLATMLAPLPIATLMYWYNFEEDYVPLSSFIALTAIESSGSETSSSAVSLTSHTENEPPSTGAADLEAAALSRQPQRVRRNTSKTLDEERERNLKYVNPNVDRELDGPWIGLEGEYVVMASADGGLVRKKLDLEEWE